ncbi:Acid phosphatase [Minicystis rosea]|nr:Acid phosphatase [Minicystis rosea]
MSPEEKLKRVTNIVVLMMENRSFDHMLGYLSLEQGRDDVDGLTGAETNPGTAGGPQRVRPMDDFTGVLADVRAVRPGPRHEHADVLEQLGTLRADGTWTMDGFVRNYEKEGHATPGVVMGYYNQKHVPMYDFLAREFTLCDRWFCSMPNWTFPNRLFSLCGESKGVVGPAVPLFFKKSFFRQLDEAGVSWRSYSHDFAIPALVDAKYRLTPAEHFSSFDDDFERHCQEGLPAVSWIDPNMKVVSTKHANDDHPPTSIEHGQRLVKRIYDALRGSPHWETTLFFIVYDEHGGFHDHVSPVPSGDAAPFEWYGPRVPAIVVSPLAPRRGVCKTTFDHTAILRTILERFCPERVANMPARVQRAAHLGHALSETAPRATPPAPSLDPVVAPVAGLHALVHAAPAQGGAVLFQAPPAEPLTDLQRAQITAQYILHAERARSGTDVVAALPEISDLERQLIAAEYLIERARGE